MNLELLNALKKVMTNHVQNGSHDSRYYKKTEIDEKLAGSFTPTSHRHTKSEITDFPSSLPANGGTADTLSKVLDVALGGTGKPTGVDASNYFLNSLSVGTSTPVDNDYFISQFVGGGSEVTTYHRRPMSSLWSYINSKLATVATSGSYNDLSNIPTKFTPASHTHNYLPLTGGTLTGNITYTMYSYTAIPFKVYGGSQNENGMGISVGAGGATIVGAGESAKACESLLRATLEELWLTSDSLIRFYTKCDTIGNKIGAVLDTNLTFYPEVSGSGSLGGSGSKWGNVYANNLHGELDGNASTATKLATARTIALTGSVTGSGTFDGSGNLSITTTTNHTHSYLPLSGGTLTGNLTVTGSTSMGDNCIASGKYSHAEGYKTTASGNESHAEGCYTLASGNYSHVDGYRTTASGKYSHAEGYYTTASGDSSHAEGSMTTASGNESHAEGHSTIALAYQHAEGHYNNTSTATSGAYYGSGTGTSFVIGNGGPGGPSNAFRVNDNGAPYSKSALVTTGCDYAEFFEWEDGNPNNEDRRGYFITTVGKKIKIAEPTDWVLGLTSGFPSIIGNGDEEWRGRYIFDNFGCPVIEEFTYEIEEYDEETEEMIMVEKTGTKWKENPDYDPTQQYIERTERQEWSASGLLGVLSVRDDGTCEVDGFCKVAEGGTATYADWSEGSYQHPVYRVVNRVTDNIVEILFR